MLKGKRFAVFTEPESGGYYSIGKAIYQEDSSSQEEEEEEQKTNSDSFYIMYFNESDPESETEVGTTGDYREDVGSQEEQQHKYYDSFYIRYFDDDESDP